jgi:F subunit of K+-transporting ATPase (Potass_KdpF).
MSFDYLIGAAVALAVAFYLLLALIRPEKF